MTCPGTARYCVISLVSRSGVVHHFLCSRTLADWLTIYWDVDYNYIKHDINRWGPKGISWFVRKQASYALHTFPVTSDSVVIHSQPCTYKDVKGAVSRYFLLFYPESFFYDL